MKIHSRTEWGARKAKPRDRQASVNVREMFVHWPGTEPRSWAGTNTIEEERAAMRSIQDFHMGPQRGWSDFAYNYAIFPSGRVYRGRGINYVPAAQLNHNTNTVACVVFLGPDDKVPDAVLHSLRELHHYVEGKAGHHIPVRPHSAVTSTECPGPRLHALIGRI